MSTLHGLGRVKCSQKNPYQALEIMVHGFYRQKVGLKTEVKHSVLPFTLVGHPVFYPIFQWSQTQNFRGTERRFSIANLNNKRRSADRKCKLKFPSIFGAQTGHPQSSCHLQLHPPCQTGQRWRFKQHGTNPQHGPRPHLPGLRQLVKDQFVAMLASKN